MTGHALTLAEVAARWRVSYEKLRLDAAAKRLPTMRFGKLIRVSWETIQAIEANGGLGSIEESSLPSQQSTGSKSAGRSELRYVKKPSAPLPILSPGQPDQALVKS